MASSPTTYHYGISPVNGIFFARVTRSSQKTGRSTAGGPFCGPGRRPQHHEKRSLHQHPGPPRQADAGVLQTLLRCLQQAGRRPQIRIIYSTYLAEPEDQKTFQDIAEEENVDVSTIYRDHKMALRQLSALFFGYFE